MWSGSGDRQRDSLQTSPSQARSAKRVDPTCRSDRNQGQDRDRDRVVYGAVLASAVTWQTDIPNPLSPPHGPGWRQTAETQTAARDDDDVSEALNKTWRG